MNTLVLIFGTIAITVIIIYIYYCQESYHSIQMDKIKYLEYKYQQKKRELDMIAMNSRPCAVEGLTNPRSCYIGSNYRCSWNEKIGRCDLIV